MAAGSKTSKVFVWIILVLLIAGLAGFGIGGLGGTISKIGSVGETEITTGDYQRALQQEINFETRRQQRPITFLEATQQGIDLRVRTNLAATAALTEETRALGLSVGDGEVARQLRSVPAFQGASGQFDREAYEFALSQNGLRPAEFEADLRRNASRELLQQAITGGITANPTYADTLFNFVAEQRSFRWAELTEDILVSPVGEPSDSDLQSYYDDNPDAFRRPELRRVSYIWVTPDMRLDDIEVDDADLREIYEERADSYRQPERRLMERLSFPDLDAATAAKADIEGGATTFAALVEARGLTLDDVDMGEVARDDVDTAIADAVFALEEPGIAGPVETNLGPTLFQVNAVLSASETTFEEAREELLQETTADRARRDILDRITEIDDLLASGATLEEVAADTPMSFGTVDFSAEVTDGIAGYDEFRAEVAQVSESDFPELRELSDGGIFALRLDEIIPPTLPPLDNIKPEVATGWRAAETEAKLSEIAENLRAQLEAGTSMEALGLEATTETDATRTSFLEGTPPGLMGRVFETDVNSAGSMARNGTVVVFEVTNISPPNRDDPELQTLLQRFNDQASGSIAADVFELFGQAVQTRHGLQLDQQAINAVHQAFITGGGN